MKQTIIPSLMTLHDSMASDAHIQSTALITILKAIEVPDVNKQLVESAGDLTVAEIDPLMTTLTHLCPCDEKHANGMYLRL